ncbi:MULTISPECIES: sigma-54-dependent transcriptional regulator [Acidithiobacillus]|uniref:Sigma-54-dependent Fis family transcriptional regulator n=2 Tax=Acidithiobacillus TaxID=119977 RepID=A0A179B666_ACIFR|nr:MULTISPECIES: sigma-54 dependent transcriptional regulator [Acidithiobacillus]MBU2846422.1 sigma-54-dependent Fis family transcriptional regulator [Acidithiobacillus ferriphilus]MBU2848488.1 sigma-54-dependent Fis family transcriptional regulator [Acidithiobacillus ferriphilus]MEB8488482.1 sigma-54 dependent transcriptional regulator [Acidithiobacillus ferriphilus]MEB8488631.1 sigma-54 dependent transcriptional regulator [Acidithiobacillus ferriphilus]MEB8491655.1 sigma-54 dependent transcr
MMADFSVLPPALIVDDEPNIVELLGITLQGMGIAVTGAYSLAEAFARLAEGAPSLCLSDLRLPDGSGIDLVRRLHALHPRVPVAVITAYSSADGAVEAMQAGAFDYMAKPIELTRLRRLISQAVDLARLSPMGSDGTQRLVGDSPVMRRLRDDIRRVARSNAPVHITGESGTGKELAARAIHASGVRHDKPFVAVNCGAIPDGLVESELFGAEKGAYSGAVQRREGLFVAANGGTIFLDEVGELPMMVQVKLLRAIQERSIRPLGASREIPLDLRFISATHRNLQEMVVAGSFRRDLLYRLDVVRLHMPPLREHPEDIPQLAEVILQRIGGAQPGVPTRLSAGTLARLGGYAFPGNVRELENLLERRIALQRDDILPEEELTSSGRVTPENSVLAAVSASAAAAGLDTAEAALLRQMLGQAGGDRHHAADLLGVSVQSLELRLSRLSLEEIA